MSYMPATFPTFLIFSVIQTGWIFPSWKNKTNQGFIGGENENEDCPVTDAEDSDKINSTIEVAVSQHK